MLYIYKKSIYDDLIFARVLQEPPVVNTQRSMVEAGPSASSAKNDKVFFMEEKYFEFNFYLITNVEKLYIRSIIFHHNDTLLLINIYLVKYD